MLRPCTVAVILICLSGLAAPAQNPPPTAPDSQQPLSPAEQHEKYIRTYDPLDKSNPAGEPATQQDTGSGQAGQNAATPLPGSVAASNELTPVNPRRSGPQVTTGDSDSSPVQEYAGPAVLSRSYTIARPMVARQVRWAPTLGISGIYDTGLSGGKVNPDGSLANVGAFGESYQWGFSGRHFWKHDQAGLEYTGNYNHYNGNSGYNGSNQLLNADLAHEFSRRLTLNLVESGSITSQSNSLLDPALAAGISAANLDLGASPSTQILDQGTRQFTTMADITWKKSARLSFDLGGGFFAVDRTGVGFYGNTGYQARGDVNYRYSRRTTIGLYYSFLDYTFSQHIQTSNTNIFGAIFSYAFGRTTQFRSRVGVARAESEGLTSVAIDPSIAALIGRSTSIVDQYRLSYLSDISAEVVKDFGRSRTANLSYARGISPGNGVLLTSVQETESGAFSMKLLHRYLASATAGYTKLTSASQTISQYGTKYVKFSLSRNYRHGLAGNFEVDYRRFTLSNAPVLHSQFRVSTGVSWGPGEGRLW
ncbi:MAG: hypothetical protein ABJC09_05200 [Terriglobia bacterium]